MVATIHDLPWMARPAILEADAGGWRHRLAVRHAARHGAALLCVSRASRRDLLRYLGKRPRARVRVVPNSTPESVAPAPVHELVGAFLVLAADRARKNIPRVRRAHARARAIDPSLPPLRVVGPPHDYVSEEEKVALLRTSTALLHISLFEGFGLPVVEAFRHGLPVVCSDRGALPEVAGDAALIADPEDEHSIADALLRIATEPELRADLRAKGLARVSELTPARTAQAWLRIHAEVCR
jgi:hypothetical protein